VEGVGGRKNNGILEEWKRCYELKEKKVTGCKLTR
jgi:hypothetical protein